MRTPRQRKRRRGLGSVLFIFATLVAALLVQPTVAFDKDATGARSVAANVRSDANAYNRLTANACTIATLSGGSCDLITVRNEATTSLSYTIGEATGGDPNNIVSSILPTTFTLAVGASQILRATVVAKPATAPCNNVIKFDVSTTTSPDAGDFKRTNFPATVTYNPCV